ncbi:MAG: DNA-directed RNA polymerase subunit K [Candidatus Thorarchaeota archaeon]|nr:MAG: DNA-directed RNA polymerase subunit K [Candidatus Thorarchaeota archaeon]
MPKGSEEKETEEATIDPASVLVNVPGVGPKTAEKLVEKGFESLEKVSKAKAEVLAENVPGLSVAKAESVIAEAKLLLKAIASGAVDVTGKPKRAKRKKAVEPDPEKHKLPPAVEMKRSVARTSMKTGLEGDLEKKGIPVAPKWLTKFEKARIIGARALQISMGAPVLVDMGSAPGGLFALAEYELKGGVLPMTVRRTLPTGEFHDIPLSVLLESTRLD